jgi:hypothetical protein
MSGNGNETLEWENGSSCLTGANPVSKAEAGFLKDALFLEIETKMAEKFPTSLQEHWISFFGFHEAFDVMLNGRLGGGCRSGACSLDVKKMFFVCGKSKPKEAYADTKSCVDGSEPMTEEQGNELLKEMLKMERTLRGDGKAADDSDFDDISLKLKNLDTHGMGLSDTDIEKLNTDAQAKYGRYLIHISIR